MKETICAIIGTIGAAIASCFGGWSPAMTALATLMAIDYASGLLLAGVFKASPKSENGTLNSNAGWKGLIKKGMVLVIVLIANQLDTVMGTQYLKDGVCIAFIVNELLSIIENAGLMGVPIPKVLTNAVEVLRDKKE